MREFHHALFLHGKIVFIWNCEKFLLKNKNFYFTNQKSQYIINPILEF